MVETGDGGAGTLAVRVHGPKEPSRSTCDDTRRTVNHSCSVRPNYQGIHRGHYVVGYTCAWQSLHCQHTPQKS